MSDNTGLRVFWNGVLRIYNCHGCCRRWYFTFNGAECSAPAAIDGVVYMIDGNSSKKNLLRVRQIEGVCEKVRKGTVRVGFWVGNCAGYGSADATTGWNSVARIYVEEVPPPQAWNNEQSCRCYCFWFNFKGFVDSHCGLNDRLI